MRIYKYTSVENALKTLRESRIKVSSSDELNDPFEFAPLINSTAFTLESCLKFLCQPEQIEHWYQIEGLPKGLSRSEFEIAYSDIDSLMLYAGIHRKVFGFHRLLSKRFP